MRQLQRAGIQSPDDAQRLPDDDILGVFPSNLGLETICYPAIRQPLYTFRQIATENDIERIVVSIRRQSLSLP